MNIFYLPENHSLKEVDILLITGDVYIDHPSFGIAIISRVLYDKGYSVCIVSQPEYFNPDCLKVLPEPKLFIGITSGNLDSMVSNYTSHRHPRKTDVYSIDGNPNFDNGKKLRPDRATIVYTSFVKQRFKDVPVVLGGLEASLRRFIHYDYVQQSLRRSILIDSKADILVYSMGEKAILEIAGRLKNKESLFGINGTCIKAKQEIIKDLHYEVLPSWGEINKDNYNLIKSTRAIEENMVFGKSSNLYQDQGNGAVICFKPCKPLSQEEIDWVYSLPYRKDFPEYSSSVPAWRMIKDSITSHRGCFGRCSFCAITSHQGPVIVSRSEESILSEIKTLTSKQFFKHTVSDIGGPTANMYGIKCKIGWCKDPHCLFPNVCENLTINENYKNLLEKAKSVDRIKNVFVTSGIRHDLALLKKEETKWIIKNATSGHLKIAPEHIDDEVLTLMKKPYNKVFIEFAEFFNELKRRYSLKFYLLPYIILSHPGSTAKSVHNLGKFLNNNKMKVEQYQDFTPSPGTLSTAMFVAKKDLDGNPIEVPNPCSLKKSQRKILEDYLR